MYSQRLPLVWVSSSLKITVELSFMRGYSSRYKTKSLILTVMFDSLDLRPAVLFMIHEYITLITMSSYKFAL